MCAMNELALCIIGLNKERGIEHQCCSYDNLLEKLVLKGLQIRYREVRRS